MVLRYKFAESVAQTVEVICASPKVKEYMIGYTSRAGSRRRSEYWKKHEYSHLVVLADRLNRKDALDLEAALHKYLEEPDMVTTNSYKKYEKTRRGGVHYRGVGQATADPNDAVHSVYMAWR